jgi:hypothetical protein
MARARQQGEEAKAEPSEADQAATERTGRGEKEGSTERFVRRRTAKKELDESAPLAARETSAAAAEEVQRVRQQGKPDPPAAGETSEAAAVKPERLSRPDKPAPLAAGETSTAAADKSERPFEKGKTHPVGGRRDRRGGGEQARAVEQASQARSAGGWRDQRGGGGCSRAAKQASRLQLQDTEAHQSDPQMLPREFSGSANNTGWLHRQGSGNDSGKSPLRYLDGRRDGAVRQGGQGLQQDALQAPEEKRREKVA